MKNKRKPRPCKNCGKEHPFKIKDNTFVLSVLCEPNLNSYGGFEVYTSLYEEMGNLKYLEWRYDVRQAKI